MVNGKRHANGVGRFAIAGATKNRGAPGVSFCHGKRNWTEPLDADNGAKVSFAKVLQRNSRTNCYSRLYAFQLAKRATVANLAVVRIC